MKYLSSFNESTNNESFSEIVEDIKDIFIDLEDFGFKIDISIISNPNKFIKLYINRLDELFIHSDNELIVFNEFLNRLNKYLNNKGMSIIVKNTIFDLILKGDKDFLKTNKNYQEQLFAIII